MTLELLQQYKALYVKKTAEIYFENIFQRRQLLQSWQTYTRNRTNKFNVILAGYLTAKSLLRGE